MNTKRGETATSAHGNCGMLSIEVNMPFVFLINRLTYIATSHQNASFESECEWIASYTYSQEFAAS